MKSTLTIVNIVFKYDIYEWQTFYTTFGAYVCGLKGAAPGSDAINCPMIISITKTSV